jgi:exodeoxyribonuclease VII small subunit
MKEENENINFEQEIENLEKIVKDLEQGNLNLDASVKQFEEGMKSSKKCVKALEEAEKKITILIEKNGEVTEEAFN